MAPTGTCTVKLVAVAAVTVARVAPKNTILLAAVVLNPVPVSITSSPGLADAGEKEVMTGAVCANDLYPINNKIESKTNVILHEDDRCVLLLFLPIPFRLILFD